MKKLICLFILTLSMVSCSSDDETSIDNSDLIGHWDWKTTDGGFAFHIHETPESLGNTVQLNINSDYSYSIIENDIEISAGTYQLKFKVSNLSNEMTRFISYSEKTEQHPGVLLSGMITINHDSNALSISQDFPDGIGSLFEQIQ